MNAVPSPDPTPGLSIQGAARRWFWVVLAVTTLWKLVAIGRLDLCFDETYYHYWSLHPQASYFDHPPLTAWAMTLSGFVFGNSPWTVRIWPLLSGLAVALIGRSLGRRLYDADTGDRAGSFLLLAPFFFGNGLVMTPDTLFAAAWAGAVWCAWQALERKEGVSPWWIGVGGCAGFGFLSKYNMILFFFSLGLLWILSPGRRAALFKGVFVAGVTALLLFLPVIWWNYRHDWISFRFQLGHGFARDRSSLLDNFSGYLLYLMVIASPALGALCFWRAGRRPLYADARGRFLAVFFWTVILFFGYAATKAKIEANWPMLAFFTGLILVAGEWRAIGRWGRRVAIVLLVAPLAAGMLYLSIPAGMALEWNGRGLDPKRTREFFGAPAVAAAVRKEFERSGADFICTSSHQMFGTLSFYEPSLRPYLWFPGKGRIRFPWIDDRVWAGKTALVAASNKREDFARYFRTVTPGESVAIPFKKHLRRNVNFWLAEGYDPDTVPTLEDGKRKTGD